ncbi:hypothetical protein WMY93_008895 [Mugilogobius chulae]|uniref:Uncharacterized protein n=1 Tax=Mugilogobius chulae TaxID=88201 RepID=A0AAW0P9X1_9GOBI
MATPQDQAAEEVLETQSRGTRTSQRTTSSSVAAARARAKAEAAKAQLLYAQKEAEILKEQAEQLKKKAELDADLHLLKSQKEVAAAVAEAQAWESSMQEDVDHQLRPQLSTMPPLDPEQRTHDYVQEQAEIRKQPLLPPDTNINETNNCSQLSDYSLSQRFQPLPQVGSSPLQYNMNYKTYADKQISSDPAHHFQPSVPRLDYSSENTGLTKYLMRREMVSSGLLKFDDQPENYWIWKYSFQNAVQGLNLSPQEELDMLAKWLGPQSATQAQRIRAAYIANPTTGLHMVWQRLEECYGAPEIIEHALLKKIEDFPKISNRENQRLRELGDILTELEGARLNGFLPGFHIWTRHTVLTPFLPNYPIIFRKGVMEVTGRLANNFVIESLDGTMQISLPALLECDMIPDDRTEIPSPEVAVHFPHLKAVADKIPAVDKNADILLLLGRDILQVHKVREQHNGLRNEPYAQRLDLGWVIVGEVCLDKKHKTKNINVYRTNILQSGRATLFSPCESVIQIKDGPSNISHTANLSTFVYPPEPEADDIGSEVFQRTQHDDKPALSIDDKCFLETLDQHVYKDSSNTWVAPLPFRSPRCRLPNNKPQAMKRLQSLQYTLNKKPTMKKHFIDFMRKMFDAGQAEPAPPLKENQECWYLPMFGVYHPQKLDQIRVVFDSSSKYEGVSLNDTLLSGPDMNNTLLGVLTRFRREPIAVTADVQQMFYCFTVSEKHRDFLRFLWFEDNDPQKPIREFRMTVHVFGNSPSPAIAIYCLRRAALEAVNSTAAAKELIVHNFYVDDGLASFPTAEIAIDILQTSQEMLAESNIRLHKVASNSNDVMQAFPPSDRAKDLKDLDFSADPLPIQRSLGLLWNLESDCFTFSVSQEEKPVTKRGILSTVNSLFDPLGFTAPVTLGGKNIMRELSTEQYDWDTELPADKQEQWKIWRDSIKDLEQLQIPRAYVPVSLSTETQYRELCVFSDASHTAIAAVAYLKTVSISGDIHVGFIMGKSKLAPRPAHTIPRLELCAAVLAVEMADFIKDEIDIDIDKVTFHTDSRIVLGYIHNASRRFYVYVSNRIARIRKSSHPNQWHFICTEENPADHGTRPVTATALKDTNWFSGPAFLWRRRGRMQDPCERLCYLESSEPPAAEHPKTKEMILNFRRHRLSPVNISGEEIEVVCSYKYLGLQLDES